MIQRIWNNPVLKEGFLLVVTAVAFTATTQLLTLADMIEQGIDLETLKGWASAAGGSVLITVIRQSVAFVTAKLAGTRL